MLPPKSSRCGNVRFQPRKQRIGVLDSRRRVRVQLKLIMTYSSILSSMHLKNDQIVKRRRTLVLTGQIVDLDKHLHLEC